MSIISPMRSADQISSTYARDGAALSVLGIGDGPYLTAILRATLRGYRYHARIAEDGLDGRTLARDASFDLVVIDVLRPGRVGMAVCQQMRAEGVATPIVMLGADSSTDAVIAGFEAGADDYLVEPFDEAELRARIMALLRRYRLHALVPV